jgi:hypothetical protein
MAALMVSARPSCKYGAESRKPQSGGVRHSRGPAPNFGVFLIRASVSPRMSRVCVEAPRNPFSKTAYPRLWGAGEPRRTELIPFYRPQRATTK